MSHFHRAPAVLDAAQKWRDRCLTADGSVLSKNRLWTLENLKQLERYYVDRPDLGEGRFLDKLEQQLVPVTSEGKQLAAEVLWILYLGMSETAMKGITKRLHIKRIWSWSSEQAPEGPPELQLLATGIANPGAGYHANKWREFAFAIELARDFKLLAIAERHRLLSEPWAFASWLDSLKSSSGRQFRHFVLALLFPAQFERIVTDQDKRKVLSNILPRVGLDPSRINYKDRSEVDQMLLELRGRLEQEYDVRPLDYYLDPLRSLWRDGGSGPDGVEPGWYQSQFGQQTVWALTAGGGARLWPEFESDRYVAIHAPELGDLRSYESREALHAELVASTGIANPVMNSLAAWQFGHEIQVGDHVLIKKGRSLILGHGVVTSDYEYDDARPEYSHVRNVEWKRAGPWRLPEGQFITGKMLTNVSPYVRWLKTVFDLMDNNAQSPDPLEQEAPILEQALKDVFLSKDEFVRILDALGRKKNVILEGAPGVGKTFVARWLAWVWMGEKSNQRIETVQFHQSYGYEDFVQGWRPSAGGGFTLQDGVFHRFCRNAGADPQNRYVFIIDEINRGNLSRIFGELMMLIESDKRGPEFAIPLTYSRSLDERFHVPENVYILGMMNTADRSLAMVDYALRRRFSFSRLLPAFGSEGFTDFLEEQGVPEEVVGRIVSRMTELNRTIAEDTRNLGPGFEIGHSYFVPSQEDENPDVAWYERVVREEIEPLLQEYWFDRPELVHDQIARLLA